MKCFMRVGFAALLIAFIVALAGSAWANEASVVSAITAFGLARQTGETGNTITIVNTSGGPLTKDISSYATSYWLLNLGDITGITIDWKADLTVTGELNLSDPDDGIGIVKFENGTFNMTAGKIEIRTEGIGWTNAITAEGNSKITVDGGTLTGMGASHCGIGGSDSNNVEVIVENGIVNFPYGVAISTNYLTVDPSVITGMTVVTTDNSKSVSVDIYGTAFTEQSGDTEGTSKIAFTVKKDAVWTLDLAAAYDMVLNKESTFLIEDGGELILNGESDETSWLDISGTFTNKGKFTNNSNVYNDSANTLDNQGTLINNGYILNDTTGKITNTGTIDNTNDGTIENKGTIDNTNGEINNEGTIKSDSFIANVGGNPVVPLYGNPEVEFPTPAVVAAAEAAVAKGLTLPPASLQAATQESCISQEKIIDDEKLEVGVISNVSSAIAFEQELEVEGGALVVGKLTLPYNDKSLSGDTLPVPSAENYRVTKRFKYGGWIHLNDLGIVNISADGAEITATLVIIDGVPDDEPGVTKPTNGQDCCGVKLVESEGEKYLFIYDGYKDGKALDPIDFENYSTSGGSSGGDDGGSNGGGGGGGCNAGYGFAGLLLLAGFVTRKYRSIRLNSQK